MTYEELKEQIKKEFDIARKEGMIHSRDGVHSNYSDNDAEDILEKIREAVKGVDNPHIPFSYKSARSGPDKIATFEQCRNAVLRLLGGK